MKTKSNPRPFSILAEHDLRMERVSRDWQESQASSGFIARGKTRTFAPSKIMNAKLFSDLRALPRPVWILFFGSFLNKFGTFVVPFLTLYMTRQGFTLANAGVAVGAYGVGNLAASLLGGHLADTIGRRKTIVLSMFSAALTMLFLSQARSFPTIVLLTAAAGLAGELYRPAASALLADLVQPEQRLTAFAAYRMAFNAGWAFGPATAGFLVERGYFWLFAGDAATSALFGIVALLALPRGVRSERQESGWKEALQMMQADRIFLRLCLATLTTGFVLFQMSSTFGLHVTHLGFSAATYGALISFNGLLVVICELPMTLLTQRLPAQRAIATGFFLLGTGFALTMFAHSVVALALCVFVFTVGEMMSFPVTSTYVASLAPATMRGRYMGTFGLTWAVGFIVGPGIGMQLFAIHPALLWTVCGTLGVLAAIFVPRGASQPAVTRESAAT